MTSLTIRPATPADSDLILHFVRELAAYEKAEHEVLATPLMCSKPCFVRSPRCLA